MVMWRSSEPAFRFLKSALGPLGVIRRAGIGRKTWGRLKAVTQSGFIWFFEAWISRAGLNEVLATDLSKKLLQIKFKEGKWGTKRDEEGWDEEGMKGDEGG